MRRCLGLTKNLHRCGLQGDWKLFCGYHKRQPLGWLVFFVFTVVAGTASIYSAIQSKSSVSSHNAVASETDDKTARELSKALTAIKDVKVSFQIGIPLTDTRLFGYRHRLEQGCKLVEEDFENFKLADSSEQGDVKLEKFNMTHDKSIGIGIGDACSDGTGVYHPCTYLFGSDSSYSPNKKDEELAYNVLKKIYVDFALYKNPISLDSFKNYSNRPKPDLTFVMIVMPETSLNYRYVNASSVLMIEGENVVCDSARLRMSENIYSIKDIVGAQLFITLNPRNLTENPAIYEETEEVRNQMHMHTLRFMINNQEIEIPKASAEPFKINRGQHASVSVIPTN